MQIIRTLLLLVMIVFLFFIILKSNGFDLTSPASIVCAMTLLSMNVMSFFLKQYGVNLSIKCIFLVTISVLSFSVAGLLKPSRLVKVSLLEDVCVYNKQVAFFSVIFVGITTLLYYREVRNVAGLLGFSSSSANRMLYYYRTATLMGGAEIASQSKIVGQMTIASFAISYLLLVDFVKRIIYHKAKESFGPFVFEGTTLIFFIIQCVLSGGRTQFLYFIESFVVLMVFFMSKKTGYRISAMSIQRILLILVITVIAFYFLGAFTGKTNKLDFATTIFVYIGAPIEAFNKLLNKVVSFDKLYFGSDVFIGPIDLLNRFGANIELQSVTAPFVMIGDTSTNIYGSFGRYYADFGVIGLILVNIFLGFFFHVLYLKLQRDNYNIERRLAIYMVLSKVLYDFCIEERFFTSVISLGTILRIIYIVIFFKLFSMRIKIGKWVIL